MPLTQSLAELFRKPKGTPPPVRELGDFTATEVDQYWTEYTVEAPRFRSAAKSEQHLQRRASLYPLFMEFMGLWGDHDDEVILDYGCGPGNDVVGFLLYTRARKVIGLDVSRTALELARNRIALHDIDLSRVELLLSGDANTAIPLETASVDYINSGGVLHHVSDPQPYLEEFHRVLRPGSTARIMVYNRDSVWFHLNAGYQVMLVERTYPELSVEDVFARTVDGAGCPIARPYVGEDFCSMCRAAGFEADFIGGYPAQLELVWLEKSRAAALADQRLADEHRAFLEELAFDDAGLPLHHGKHAGVGGVYELRRPE